MVLAGFIIFFAFSIAIFLGSGTGYSPMFSNVTEDQLTLVIGRLREKKVPFKLTNNGKTIEVPTEILHATQMSIMADLGNAEINVTGLESFKTQEFGETSLAQRINYQRALQGEIMRSINTISAVNKSKVILALPSNKVSESGHSSASITLQLHPGKSIEPEQVWGIIHLVASSVEGLSPENVTVVDTTGKVLSMHFNSRVAASAEFLEIKKKWESEFEERLESLVSRVVGVGKAVVRVNVTLNAKNTDTLKEIVDPDSVVLRGRTKSTETSNGDPWSFCGNFPVLWGGGRPGE